MGRARPAGAHHGVLGRPSTAPPFPAKVRGVYIEDKSSGTGLIQSLRRIVSLCDMPVIAVQRNRDKVSRVHDVVPFIRAADWWRRRSRPG